MVLERRSAVAGAVGLSHPQLQAVGHVPVRRRRLLGVGDAGLIGIGTLTGIVAVIRDETSRFQEDRLLRKRLAELEASARA